MKYEIVQQFPSGERVIAEIDCEQPLTEEDGKIYGFTPGPVELTLKPGNIFRKKVARA